MTKPIRGAERPAVPAVALHEAILRALDCSITASEWDVADDLLRAMETLCGANEHDSRLIEAYMRLVHLLDRREH